MTSADQTGQFHTGSSDRPAAEPSVFQGMGDPPSAGVQAEESVTDQLAAAAHPQPPEESEEPVYEEPEEDVARREKAQKTDADRVELMRLDQLSTEPADEKKAQAITKENEELQLAAHAARLDALEVAEKENAKVEKAQEAEAKKAEKGEARAQEPEAKKAETAKTVEAAKATEKAAAKTTAAAQKAEPEEEYEEVDVEDLTVPELKAELDDAGVDYPSDARKADLVKLVKKTQK